MRTEQKARWARLRVFVTAIAALAILGLLVSLLTGGTLFTPKARLRTYIDDSGGMPRGAPVLFNGVRIGKVTSIDLSHLNDPLKVVLVEMRVERRFLPQIPEDSRTEVFSETLGDKYLSIEPGKSRRPVTEDATLAHKPAGIMLSRIDLTTFEARLRTIDDMFRDIEAGRGTVGQLVKGDQLYKDIVAKIRALQQSIESAAETESPMGSALYGQELYRNISAPLERLDNTLAEIQAGRGDAGKLLRDPALYEQLRRDMADLRSLTAEIGSGSFISTDEMYVNVSRSLASLIRSVDDFNAGAGMGQYLISEQVYESLNGSVKEMQKLLGEFRRSPQKYLRIKLGLF